MLDFKLYFTLPDGTEDDILVSGDSIEEIREKCDKELKARNATDPWTKMLPPF